MDKCLNLLGIAKKAGLLEIGEECVSTSAEKMKVRCVFSAKDAADGSKRKAAFIAEECRTPHIVLPYTKAELSAAVGRGMPGILAITDIGLAASLAEGLAAADPEYTETSQKLALKQKRALERKHAHNAAGGKTKGINAKGR